MTYDVKCYELARHFLADYEIDDRVNGMTRAVTHVEIDRLAKAIQRTVEDYLAGSGLKEKP